LGILGVLQPGVTLACLFIQLLDGLLERVGHAVL
jgi:hypothetical protein